MALVTALSVAWLKLGSSTFQVPSAARANATPASKRQAGGPAGLPAREGAKAAIVVVSQMQRCGKPRAHASNPVKESRAGQTSGDNGFVANTIAAKVKGALTMRCHSGGDAKRSTAAISAHHGCLGLSSVN